MSSKSQTQPQSHSPQRERGNGVQLPELNTTKNVGSSKRKSNSGGGVGVGNGTRDISFLIDRKLKPEDSKIPPTMIPEKYHVKETNVTPPLDGSFQSEFNEQDRMWHTTIFPGVQPSGRREVMLLDEWLNKMLHSNMNEQTDALDAVKQAQKLYSMAFHEIIRQVWCQCKERGILMDKIWTRYLQLFEHILKMREHEREQYNKKIVEHQSMYQQLYKTKDEKFNKMYLQLAAEKERITMTKDKLERAMLVLREEYKKRIQRETNLVKYIKKLRKGQLQIGMQSSASNTNLSGSGGNGTQSTMSNSISTNSIADKDKDDDFDDDYSSYLTPESLLAKLDDLDQFSDNNFVLVNKLESIEANLLETHKLLTDQKSSDPSSIYATQLQIEGIATALSDAIRKMNKNEETNKKQQNNRGINSSLSNSRGSSGVNNSSTSTSGGDNRDHNDKMIDKQTQTNDAEESSQFIPQSLVEFFSINQSDTSSSTAYPPIPRIIPKEWVIKTITLIYLEKAIRDEERDRQGKPRQSLPEFLYEFFISLYGLRKAAELNIIDFVASVHKYRQILRVRLFSQFCRLSGELEPIHTELNLFLKLFVKCLQVATPSSDEDNKSSGSGSGYNDDESQLFISLLDAKSMVIDIFADADSINSRVESICVDNKVDADRFLEMIVNEGVVRTLLKEEELASLFVDEHEGEKGVLGLDEFINIVRKLNPILPNTISDRELLQIFRELVGSSQVYTIDNKTLIETFHKYNLLNWRIYDINIPIQIDSKLKNDVSFDFLESTWETQEGQINEMMRNLQGGLLIPKTYHQLQDYSANFKKYLMKRTEPELATKSYRCFMEKLYSGNSF